jgi:hypothetical protein
MFVSQFADGNAASPDRVPGSPASLLGGEELTALICAICKKALPFWAMGQSDIQEFLELRLPISNKPIFRRHTSDPTRYAYPY